MVCSIIINGKYERRFKRTFYRVYKIYKISYLKHDNIIKSVLDLLLQYIPHQEVKRKNRTVINESPLSHSSYEMVLSIKVTNWEKFYEYLFCYTIFLLPVVTREWWDNLDKNIKSDVRLYVQRYITPFILQKEIDLLRKSSSKKDGLVFQCLSNEVYFNNYNRSMLNMKKKMKNLYLLYN